VSAAEEEAAVSAAEEEVASLLNGYILASLAKRGGEL
jgi:hypothetical protein